MKPLIFVDSDSKLARLARTLSKASVVGMDTEGNSFFAYRERLCLLQITARGRDYIVDPLAGLDLGVLASVFADPGVLKIFHDAEYDLLMLQQHCPLEVRGLFDTRVAASALGMQNVGLAALLDEIVGVKLDKKYQRSDWGKRPLTEGQLDYARHDTHYLPRIADELRGRLTEAGAPTVFEVAAECRRLEGLVPQPRRFDPDGYGRIKGAQRLDGKGRRVLRELYKLRERIAEDADQPPVKVLAPDALLEIARQVPEDLDRLARIRGVSGRFVDRNGERVLSTLRRARRQPAIDRLPSGRKPDPVRKLANGEQLVHEALRDWRKAESSRRGVDASLVLHKGTMLELARLKDVPADLEALAATGLLEPWRIQYHGEGILAAMQKARRPSGASAR